MSLDHLSNRSRISRLLPPGRSLVVSLLVLGVCSALGLGALLLPSGGISSDEPKPAPSVRGADEVRRALFQELQPVALANCTLERFGERNDGGYLMCGNLLGSVAAGYSYGISGYDGWGCDISRRTGATVHQYDCFDTTRPVCESGRTALHAECIAGTRKVDDAGRIFDTLANQLTRDGNSGKRIVLKMDVEGAEWESLEKATDEVLRRIDQLAIEMHGSDDERFLRIVQRLKTWFHVAHLHFNNYSCSDQRAPFPTWAYEVLFVNRAIGIPEPGGVTTLPHPLDAPNDPKGADCQVAASR